MHYTTSAVAEHAMKTGYKIKWESAKVSEVNDHALLSNKLEYLEAWNIRLQSQSMNG